jgi:hypothetical protein
MNPNKWDDIIFQIEEKFGIEKHFFEDFVVAEQSDGKKIMGKKEIIEFKGPLGKMRIEKISRPKIIDKKVLASRRIGSKAVVEYIYSNEEFVDQIKIYRFDDATNNWQEITANGL